MIKGEMLVGDNNEVSLSDILIFKKLLSFSSDLPFYVQQIWKEFKNKQESIKINMKCMYKYYKSFMLLLFSSDPKFKNLLLFNKIIKIFPNANEIICEKTDWDGDKRDYFSSIVCSNFIGSLKDMLSEMEQNKTNKLKKIIKELKKEGVFERNFWTGLRIHSIDEGIAKYYNLNDTRGVIITDVIDGSPAKKAGLEDGDIIREVDGYKIDNYEMLKGVLQSYKTDETILMDILRNNQQISVKMKLERRP